MDIIRSDLHELEPEQGEVINQLIQGIFFLFPEFIVFPDEAAALQFIQSCRKSTGIGLMG